MAHEKTVMELMNQLVYATKHDIGNLMAHKGIWTAGVSAVNNSYKILIEEAQAGRLEKGATGYFKLVGAKGDHQEHSQLLTKALSEIIKLNYQTTIFREHEIKIVGLRPDALVHLVDGTSHICAIIEVCNNETSSYLLSKINSWKSFEGAKDYLSQLFKTKIKEYDFVVSGDEVPEEVYEFQQYMEDLKK